MNQCRSCRSRDVHDLISLGPMPLVNNFLKKEDIFNEKLYELDLKYCKLCNLIQLGTTVPPADLYLDYQHLSSASQINLYHLDSVAEYLRQRVENSNSKRVLEIGSNDGSLLKRLANIYSFVLGVDPAENLAEIPKKSVINVVSNFFSSNLANEIKETYGKFDTIVGLNVVPHTENFIDLLVGVESLLSEKALFVFEFAYVIDTIMGGDFDTIYHEHIYNFSMSSITHALESVNLTPIDVMKIPTQGGSLRVVAQRSCEDVTPSSAVRDLLDDEECKGHNDITNFLSIKENIEIFRDNLLTTLKQFRRGGKRIIALGAPARGTVVFNFCGIDSSLVEMVIDDTSLKQGKLMPGVHIPVHNWPALASQSDEDVFLLVSWNYKQEVMKKLAKYRANCTLIEYFPELKVTEMFDLSSAEFRDSL